MTINIHGVNALGNKVRNSDNVVAFTDSHDYMTVKVVSKGLLNIITPKGSYYLKQKSKVFVGHCSRTSVTVELHGCKGTVVFN